MRMVAPLACALTAALLCGAGALRAQTPVVPASDDEVVERLPAGNRDPAVREALVRRPAVALDDAARLREARLLLETARRTGDARLLDRAQAMLASDTRLDDPRASRLRAAILTWRHDFDGARAEVAGALERDPDAPGLWFALAGIERISGRLGQAAQACRRAYDLTPSPSFALCAADVASLRGRPEESADWIARADDRLALDDDAAGWRALTRARMAARAGDDEAATVHYRRALLVADATILASYAHWALARDAPDDAIRAIRLLARGGEDGMDDDLAVSLAIALRRSGDEARSRELADRLARRFETADRAGWPGHWRARARHALWLQGDPGRALDYARRNWAGQRESVDARLLAEAARAAGETGVLEDLRRFVAETGFSDVGLARLLAAGTPS